MRVYHTDTLLGRTFGRWTVTGFVGRSKNRQLLWQVTCQCGTTSTISTGILNFGKRTMCRWCRRQTTASKGRSHYRWKGGRYVKQGYVVLQRAKALELYPNATIPNHQRHIGEHQAVMSHHLQRALYPGETVHHKNGVRRDNRLENLELKVAAHGPGQNLQDRIQDALDLLKRYAPEHLK